MKKFQDGGITAIDVYGNPASTGADPFGGFVSRPQAYIGDVGGLPLTQAEEEANLRAELAKKEEYERGLLEDIQTAEAVLEGLYRQRDVTIDPDSGEIVSKQTGLPADQSTIDPDTYFPKVAEAREVVRQTRQAARDAGLNIPGDGPLDSVGQVLSRASDYTGVPLPDLVTGGPGGVTAVFGVPEGKSVLARPVPGTTGSTYTGGPMRAGVITGNPAIDLVLGNIPNEGDEFFNIPTLGDITDILTKTGGVAGVISAAENTKGFTPDKGTDKKTKFGVTSDGGPDKDDNKGGSSLDDDKGGGGSPLDDKGGSPLDDKGGSSYLDLNKGDGSDPDSDKGTSTTGGGGDGGGGAGYTQGIGVHSGDPGDIVDLDYLYDISGSSIFAPRLQDEGETDDNRPYVYAKSGGMIHNNYDLTDEILRRLIRGR